MLTNWLDPGHADHRCPMILSVAGPRRPPNSWFFGSTNPENVRGRFLLFAGGVPLYREIFAEVAAKGYEGFELR